MTMRSRSKCERREDGFALAAVLFVLALLGVLSITSLVTTDDERRASVAMRESAKAFYAAEAGVSVVLASWDSLQYDTLMSNPGDSVDLGWQTVPENGTSYRALMRRVSSKQLFSLGVQGRSGGAATSQVQVLLRKNWNRNVGTIQAALYAASKIRKNSSDGVTTGFDACSSAELAGLKTPYLQFGGDRLEVFNGAPPIDTVTNDPVDELQSTGIDWQGILDSDFTYTITDETEWPDFSSMPEDFYPSILVTGDRIDLRGLDHNGRGFLVVTEELRINNDWEFDGVILVGNFFQSNGKMTIKGAMISGLNMLLGVDPADIVISAIGPGQAQITYDSCIVSEAMNADGGAGGVELVDGSWFSIS